ncbi:MAG: DUF4256 domain-containing protein [Terrimicrobiaceae bacterium]|nr:DUF4256 domain-containing protein [Terrimicrobiaceae bacterium]
MSKSNLLSTLRSRFDKHPERHRGIPWADVEKRLDAGKLSVLARMEETGGEPDVIGRDKATGEIVFADCSTESPKGRRSVCYDREGWLSRKEHRPETTASDLAAEIGIELLTEDDYLALQKLGEFDLKTSSWIKTPPEIRSLGGALYAERRYDRVFIGHNGAQSYYGVRGFRGLLRI